MPRTVRLTVAPEGKRAWMADAARAGGAELVPPSEAEALIWAQGAEPERLHALLREAPGIRWVQLPLAGVEAFAGAGVLDGSRVWTSAKGVYARPVAEHALALALAGLRELARFARASGWSDQAGISLMGGRVTIFGGGGIARTLVRLLRPFDCTITVVRRHRRALDGVERTLVFDERYEALGGADVVFVACALTEDTRGLIGDIELELMEPHAWLVNVGRGEQVVTDDLVSALTGDVIGGAALDVTDPEPLPDGHPLWSLPNCLITPHTANTEDMAEPLLTARITDNVRRFAAGAELLGRVDPALGY